MMTDPKILNQRYHLNNRFRFSANSKATFTPCEYKHRPKNQDFRPRATSGDCCSRESRQCGKNVRIKGAVKSAIIDAPGAEVRGSFP